MTNVLLIDGKDGKDGKTNMHDLMKMTFEALLPDYSLLFASDGSEGLDMVRNSKPDLILSEIVLEDLTLDRISSSDILSLVRLEKISGFDVCMNLKNNPETRNIPFIFLTAQVFPEQKILGFAVGAEYYIKKPFELDDITNKIKILTNGEWKKYDTLYFSEKNTKNGISVVIGKYLVQKPALDCVVSKNNEVTKIETINDLEVINWLEERECYKKGAAIELKNGKMQFTVKDIKAPFLYNCFMTKGLIERIPTIDFLKKIATSKDPLDLPGYGNSRYRIQK